MQQRVCAIGCALVTIAVLCVTLSACSQTSQEDVIRDGIAEEFNRMKALEDDFLNELVKGATESEGLKDYGVTVKDFCKEWLSGFDYTIDEVKVDGKDATAKVTLSVKSLPNALATCEKEVSTFTAATETASMTEAAINKEIGEMFMDALSDAKVEKVKVELPYEQDENGVWKPASGYDKNMKAAFAG